MQKKVPGMEGSQKVRMRYKNALGFFCFFSLNYFRFVADFKFVPEISIKLRF